MIRNTASMLPNTPSMVQNEASMIQNEASMVQNEASMVQNEASMVRNEASMVRNEASMVRNEASMAQNEASMVRNEASIVRNEASMVQNEARMLQNEYGQASAASNPGTTRESHSDCAETRSRSSDDSTASTDLPSRARNAGGRGGGFAADGVVTASRAEARQNNPAPRFARGFGAFGSSAADHSARPQPRAERGAKIVKRAFARDLISVRSADHHFFGSGEDFRVAFVGIVDSL
jgi:hypothetical protein